METSKIENIQDNIEHKSVTRDVVENKSNVFTDEPLEKNKENESNKP